jgi:hypothetical protein
VDYVDNSGDYSPAPAASIPVDPDTGEVLEGEIISDADGDAVDSFFGEE